MLHMGSSGTFSTTAVLQVGASLEPYSSFTTSVGDMVVVHVSLPAHSDDRHSEIFSGAMRAVSMQTKPEYRYFTMRPLMGICNASREATTAWVNAWLGISQADWSMICIANIVVLIDKRSPEPSPKDMDRALIPLADKAITSSAEIRIDNAEIRPDDGVHLCTEKGISRKVPQ